MSQTISSSSTSSQRHSLAHTRKQAKAERLNSALRFALFMHNGSQALWDKLIAAGASDLDISHHLVDEFGDGGGSQTDEGIQFAYQGLPFPRFWLDCPSIYTTAKPTLSEIRLVKRVRELLQIPQLASSEVASGAGKSETKTKQQVRCAACKWQGDSPVKKRLRVAGRDYPIECRQCHAIALEPLDDHASNGDAVRLTMTDEQKTIFLADLEEEQKNRFETLQGYDKLLSEKQTVKNKRRLKTERAAILNDYEQVYEESVIALAGDSDAVQEVRDRVEAESSIIAIDSDTSGTPASNGGCPPDCGHTDAEHAAFDLGVKAGEEGVEDCPYDDRDLGTAWHIGHSVGTGNRTASATPAETDDAGSQSAIVATPTKVTHTRDLECELSDSDLLNKLNDLTDALVLKDSIETELKEVSAGYKGRIKTLDREIHSLTRTITSKRERREVECRERFNFDEKKVEVIRVDTFDVVESRVMTARELQQTLPSI